MRVEQEAIAAAGGDLVDDAADRVLGMLQHVRRDAQAAAQIEVAGGLSDQRQLGAGFGGEQRR